MKLDYEPIGDGSMKSIHVKRTLQPYLAKNWHFHPEYEILYIIKGKGMRVVGDHISNFTEGELVLIGKWLPHLWRHDKNISSKSNAVYYNVKFLDSFHGVDIFSIPEIVNIQQLLRRSSQGILFNANVIHKVHDLIIQLIDNKPAFRLIHLLQILEILSQETNVQYLSSNEFILPTKIARELRLQKVINYIFENHHRYISLEDISAVASMTPNSFCRYFKNCTNKTFFHFLNEFRISKACQILTNDDKLIKEICYEVGFNSTTNFNRTFKRFKDVTPLEYRKNLNIQVAQPLS